MAGGLENIKIVYLIGLGLIVYVVGMGLAGRSRV